MLFYQKFWEAVGTGWAVVLKKQEEVRFLKKGEEASVSYCDNRSLILITVLATEGGCTSSRESCSGTARGSGDTSGGGKWQVGWDGRRGMQVLTQSVILFLCFFVVNCCILITVMHGWVKVWKQQLGEN